jgi:uncharacterized repeat protein (TIGR01451 family)
MVLVGTVVESKAVVADPSPLISSDEFKKTTEYNLLARDTLGFVSMNSDNGISSGGDMTINELPPYNSLVQGMFRSDIGSKNPKGVAFGVGGNLKIRQYAQSPLKVNINSGNIKIADLGGLVVNNRDVYGNPGNTRVFKLDSTNYVNVVSGPNQLLSTVQEPYYGTKVIDQYNKIKRDIGRMGNCQGLKVVNPNSDGLAIIDSDVLSIGNSENNVSYIRLRGDDSNLRGVMFRAIPDDNKTVIIETSSQKAINNARGFYTSSAKNIIWNYTGEKLFIDEGKVFGGNVIANDVSIGTGAIFQGSITAKNIGIDPSRPLPNQEFYRLTNGGISNTLTCRQKPITKFPDLRVNIRAPNGRDIQNMGYLDKVEFDVSVTNLSKESVKNVYVTDNIAPECSKFYAEVFVDETITYRCSLPFAYVHYFNPVHKIDIRGVTYDSNRVVINSDTTLVNVKKFVEL